MCVFRDAACRAPLVLHFGDVPAQESRDTMSALYRGPFVHGEGAGRAGGGAVGHGSPHSRAPVPTVQDGKRLSTLNARRKGQHCIIAAQSYVEPY